MVIGDGWNPQGSEVVRPIPHQNPNVCISNLRNRIEEIQGEMRAIRDAFKSMSDYVQHKNTYMNPENGVIYSAVQVLEVPYNLEKPRET